MYAMEFKYSLHTAVYHALNVKLKKGKLFLTFTTLCISTLCVGKGESAQNITQLLRKVCQASNDLATYALISLYLN